MKKLLSVLILLMVAILMTLTRPDKERHKEAMLKAIAWVITYWQRSARVL